MRDKWSKMKDKYEIEKKKTHAISPFPSKGPSLRDLIKCLEA